MNKTLQFKWTVSRGRDTAGYNICSLYVDGKKVSACNGGGYDMKGTALGTYIEIFYKDRLLQLKESDMPTQSHWEREEDVFFCKECIEDRILKGLETVRLHYKGADWQDAPKCPECGAEMQRDYNAGHRVDDGRYFYGLTFHDPDYDAGKAIIGADTTDRTFGGAEGQTVEQAEKEGKSLGLERYQAIYRASSNHPTEKHIVPTIDGACGFSSVEKIMKAIGLELERTHTTGKNLDIYILHDSKEQTR